MTGVTTLPAPYPDTAVLSDGRRAVEDLVCGLPGGAPEQRSFDYPWEIRAFAMAVAAHHRLRFEWMDFQQALIASIHDWESTKPGPWSYYEHWLAALERVLANAGLVAGDVLDEQTRTVLELPPNRNHHEAHTKPIAVDPAHV
jgi:nitrile hydratase accessory protein